MRTLIADGTVLDTESMSYLGERHVVIEDGRIVSVDDGPPPEADVVIDAAGRYVLPGLIDGHVHFRLATMDLRALSRMTEVEFGVRMASLARATVERGFTTVRDLGGELYGLISSIRKGLVVGPRIVRAGRMLSQTGGHGDMHSDTRVVPECGCQLDSDVMSIVADGVEAVRKAARFNLKDGSDFIKVHVSGGVASPSDPLESVQYTREELEAVVTECDHRGTYVAAHAYLPEAIQMAVRAGVHSIEHGNLIDAETATLMASEGAVMVPTLATYFAMDALGKELGLPDVNMRKNVRVMEAGLASLELAASHGVTLAYGTDLLGESQVQQARELAIRAQVQPAEDILRSMWIETAKLCRLEGEIGVLAPGAFGDVVVSTVNPLDDIVGFSEVEESLTQVIQGGRVIVDR
ncbi:MAG: amidohydrolase family protein [Actinomycetota bacterium]